MASPAVWEMRVGVISDTHLAGPALELPARVIELFAGVDLILHAGDLIDLAVLDELRAIAPVEAVHGNMDPIGVVEKLPGKKVLELGSFRIGLTHGSGDPFTLAARVAELFADDRADVIVFGHSHRPLEQARGGQLLFNPGSPTDQRFSPDRSVGLLEIGEKVTGRILKL